MQLNENANHLIKKRFFSKFSKTLNWNVCEGQKQWQRNSHFDRCACWWWGRAFRCSINWKGQHLRRSRWQQVRNLLVVLDAMLSKSYFSGVSLSSTKHCPWQYISQFGKRLTHNSDMVSSRFVTNHLSRVIPIFWRATKFFEPLDCLLGYFPVNQNQTQARNVGGQPGSCLLRNFQKHV